MMYQDHPLIKAAHIPGDGSMHSAGKLLLYMMDWMNYMDTPDPIMDEGIISIFGHDLRQASCYEPLMGMIDELQWTVSLVRQGEELASVRVVLPEIVYMYGFFRALYESSLSDVIIDMFLDEGGPEEVLRRRANRSELDDFLGLI